MRTVSNRQQKMTEIALAISLIKEETLVYRNRKFYTLQIYFLNTVLVKSSVEMQNLLLLASPREYDETIH